MTNLTAQRERFYTILEDLRARVGLQTLGDCTGRDGWPAFGVYFFFEDGERRHTGHGMRIVRVGTHAVSRGSKATLWRRLSTHRGTLRTGGGNHRGSIFRRHVGIALQRAGRAAPVCATWGEGGSAPRDIRARELHIEQAVSDHIRGMPFLWVATGPDSAERSFIERNSIALLSRVAPGGDEADAPSEGWLGMHATHDEIRSSGLWNVKHVKDPFDDSFMSMFERCAEQTVPLQRTSRS